MEQFVGSDLVLLTLTVGFYCLATRLRLGQGADTRHEPVYRQEDAYRQGASEIRIQGHAISGQRLKTITIND